jgi:[protein-PII] uridylyltransferase
MSDAMLERIASWMGQGIQGRLLAQQYTAYMDTLISGIFRDTGNPENLLLLATGGYGRKELAPFSDIDIMFYAPNRDDAAAAEKILYRLWDSKIDISHAFRTPKECLDEAFKDVRTRTTLLESRYLAGSRKLYEQFRKDVYPSIAFRKQRQFVSEKLKEMEKRHLSSGDSIYLLEPHIKEGDGGLRDIHTIFWLSNVVHKIVDVEGLQTLISPQDHRRLLGAYDFLIQARFCLHLECKRKNDILSFEYQKAVAACLGFRDTKKFSGAERMMRYYYLKSRIIRDVSHAVMVLCSREYTPVFRDFTRKRLSADFLLSGGRIIAEKDDLFVSRPEKVMEAYYYAAKTGKSFSSALRERIRESLLRINRSTRNNPEAVQYFLEIMKGNRVYDTIREMHETGVLGRFIPEFGALRSLVVHEPYHLYTVDEHSLMAIRNLERLRTTTVMGLIHLKGILQGMERTDVLFLSILFHDIGKAIGRHHEEEGYKRLKSLMERYRFEPRKRNRIEVLVRNHILMSRLARTREVSDPDVIAAFAETVGDSENLKAIYLITYADMSAVNPHFWTAWKASLLRELYDNTERYLAGYRQTLTKQPGSIIASFPRREQPALAAFIEEMTDRYLIATPEAGLKEDFKLYARAKENGFSMRIDIKNDSVADIILCTTDAPGLFSRIVGYLSMKRLNIVHGRIFTGKTGIVIDKISVSNWNDFWWEGCEEDLAEGLEDAVLGMKNIEPVRQKNSAHDLYGVFIDIDNESMASLSIIEIFSQDRIGLLYDIAQVLYAGGVNIISARINTEVGLAQDVFLVQENGGKVSAFTLHELMKGLWKTLKN